MRRKEQDTRAIPEAIARRVKYPINTPIMLIMRLNIPIAMLIVAS
jgi:hypothetical protein